MIWIDIVCIAVILILALLGIWRGLLKSIFRLLAWIGALVGAYFSQDLIGETIASLFDINGFMVKLVCICIGFLVPFLILSLVGIALHKFVSSTSISKANRILGGILGALKGCLICFVFLSILHILPVSGVLREARNNSVSYSAYKFSLETMGFSSEEIDLVKVAEEKASKLTKEITDKAVEKATESASQAAKDATDAAAEAAQKAAEDAKQAAKETAKKAKKKYKRIVDEEGDEIEYESNADIPIDE